ncbi:pentapeptide repeat-containing protein [Crocosphaera sp.]|uniref:pentapeptide repeat-containing protein n=1 Tax=Crocosphaera sp. TaxID=2729996 RepID=UPI00257E2D84|nr:pentapeptide repeat-containing protein [Crocosphaera sp.]NQZ62497.1 pentapeptide repeat-containing protein [Crocosphaera sp.]
MANRQHLALLIKGVKFWNKWRLQNPKISPDLSEAHLTKANLTRANLSGANLTRADLSGANLTRANLEQAILDNVTFRINYKYLTGKEQQQIFLKTAPWQLRLFNFMIDDLISLFIIKIGYTATLLSFIYFFHTGEFLNVRNFIEKNLLIASILLIFWSFFGYFLYYFISEVIFQKSLSKIFTKTRVITIHGLKPNISTIAKRSFYRLIPLEYFSWNRQTKTCWHDRWTRTLVITESEEIIKEYKGFSQTFLMFICLRIYSSLRGFISDL